MKTERNAGADEHSNQ
jgi:hypothetical protein